MDLFSGGLLVGIPAGMIAGFIGVLVMTLILPGKKCPECGARLPKLRNTWDSRTVVRTCPGCGCGFDIKGRKVEE